MIDLASLSVLLKIGQQLTGFGSNAEAAERAQIVRYMHGVADRLNAISAVIRGASEQNLSQLCASLEGYGRVGAQQLSAILSKAQLGGLDETIMSVARAIREQSRSEWTPETRQAALRDLDDAIGQFSGMASFLEEFSGNRRSPVAPKVVGVFKKVSFQAVVAAGATTITGLSAKAANLIPGAFGAEAAKAVEDAKEKVIDVTGTVDDNLSGDSENT